MWQPTTLTSDGPARPDWTLRASSGKLSLQANRNPTQAHGTSSKARCCFYPRERLTVERHKTALSWQGARSPTDHSRTRE
jgi:hypothetical protein